MLTLLRIAVEIGESNSVEKILAAGDFRFKKTWTALHEAAASGGNPAMHPACKGKRTEEVEDLCF